MGQCNLSFGTAYWVSRGRCLRRACGTEVVPMFLAAALLMFGLPQSAPGAFAGSTDSTGKTEIVKESAAPSSALPAAPTSKVAADATVPAAGGSSSVSAEPFLPGA